MTDLFSDERLQFFLRNREDIKAWATIESDVMAATRELLGRSQPALEEALLAIDPRTIVGRNDSGQWERIIARHEHWPLSVGVALEWNRSVDPLGATAPKIGVFWWADPPSLVAPRTQLVESVSKSQLQGLGFKVPLEGVWPVGARANAEATWWQDPEVWIASIVERLAAAWPLVAPHIDDALGPMNPQVSGG